MSEQDKNYNPERTEVFHDTQNILKKGCYETCGKVISLQLSEKQRKAAEVYLPETIAALSGSKDEGYAAVCTEIHVYNRDSFEQAIAREHTAGSASHVLVLNLANAHHPGGGVQKGSKAQEEDLCRRSSLYESLTSDTAKEYYDYNDFRKDRYLGTDAVMLAPAVEIFKDSEYRLLDHTEIVSVLSCAAPRYEERPQNTAEYRKRMYRRIEGILKVAAYRGYEVLVLGAFGCGAFHHDAAVVAEIFADVIRNFRLDGKGTGDYFRIIDFAVLDHSQQQYNYESFRKVFADFSWNAEPVITVKDRIRGCMIGGAAGDALGYPVEFCSEAQIFRKYGTPGISEYELRNGKAEISDDTQMTMFTANGLLFAQTRGENRGFLADHSVFVAEAYQEWLDTQNSSWKEHPEKKSPVTWLRNVPELYAQRAPGITCLNALQVRANSSCSDFINAKINDSKGCGGIMRVAPVALLFRETGRTDAAAMEAAQIAAITHTHTLGYMPAAALTYILYGILKEYHSGNLRNIVLKARDRLRQLFTGYPHLTELTGIMDLALRLSANDRPDLENIHEIGEGWVAEETLGIALYCALKYEKDFSKAIITAVNHNGDSDSTGAVTGNIVGAIIGYEAMDEKWKKNLELSDLLLELADDLYISGHRENRTWEQNEMLADKYIYCRHEKKTAGRYTFFWKPEEENGCFSNWYKAPFVIDDFKYFCTEQYMMAKKAKMFHDAENYTKILRSSDPQECKDLGKEVRPFDSKKWDEVSYEIVKEANRAKYLQNPALKQKLLDTGDTILAEASKFDAVWGIHMTAAEAATVPMSRWQGTNKLGKILMELREEFRKEQTEDSSDKGTMLRMIRADITTLKDVDAIVNAANTSLLGGGGVDGAIHRAAGPQLLEECRKLHGCRTGEAKITGAYRLPCKYVIHTAGPVWQGGTNQEFEKLEDCYWNSLQLAVENGIRRIAFPSISTGVYHFPVKLAARKAIETVQEFIEENPGTLDLVEWALFDDSTLQVYQDQLDVCEGRKNELIVEDYFFGDFHL